MSAVWSDGSTRSKDNAFSGAAFVQPHRPPAPLTVGQNIKNIKEPRKVVRGDATDMRFALNGAGRFVSVRMDVPSTSIAPKSDCWGTYE